MVQAIRGDGLLRVDLECIGEGWNGDWNPDDPNDEPLMRFDVYARRTTDQEWEEVADSSYCTQVSDNLPDVTKQEVCNWLLDQIKDFSFDGRSFKRDFEELSWVGVDDGKIVCCAGMYLD